MFSVSIGGQVFTLASGRRLTGVQPVRIAVCGAFCLDCPAVITA